MIHEADGHDLARLWLHLLATVSEIPAGGFVVLKIARDNRGRLSEDGTSFETRSRSYPLKTLQQTRVVLFKTREEGSK